MQKYHPSKRLCAKSGKSKHLFHVYFNATSNYDFYMYKKPIQQLRLLIWKPRNWKSQLLPKLLSVPHCYYRFYF